MDLSNNYFYNLLISFYFIIFIFIFVLFYKVLEPSSIELQERDGMPKLLVFGIALVGLGLLLANTALVAWFLVRKKIKGKR
jgi:hypothetical protein